MAISANKTQLSENVVRLVDQHWTHLQARISEKPQQNIIFVLGGPGAGKSTVSQVVCGDFPKLRSKLCQKETVMCPRPHPQHHYLIEDEQGLIRNFHSYSETILPEFLSLDDTTSFVDCPSFDDNTDNTQEIVARALMKNIVEQVTAAKFLWVIPSSSLFDNMQDTLDFTVLFDNAKLFFRNLDKIKDSISLVITKVRDCDPFTDEYISDEEIFEKAETFLKYFSGYANKRSFVDCLLDAKSKWALIRSPTREGPLSNMDHFLQAREQIRELCQVKLEATEVTPNDLEWPVSMEYPEWVTQTGKLRKTDLTTLPVQ